MTHAPLSPFDRSLGCLIGLAVGDALGSTLEFSVRDSKPKVTDLVGGGPFNLRAGQWTDDTSMALCLADSLIANSGFDPKDVMDRFVRWWRHGENSSTGECFDIGSTTVAALRSYEETGKPFANVSRLQSSSGNGSLMRLCPVVIFAMGDHAKARILARRQSQLTHASAQAVDACEFFATLLLEALNGVAKEQVLGARRWDGTRAVKSIARAWWAGKRRDEISSSGYAIDTLEAAMWCVSRTGNFENAVVLAANLGHDSDTVAAVTGQLAGAIYGLNGPDGIPARWCEKLWMFHRIQKAAEALHAASHAQAKVDHDAEAEAVRQRG